MQAKMYTVRGCAVENGKNTVIELDLEFDGKRAFVIWDSVNLGSYRLKARLEIDPSLLKPVRAPGCDFLYCGELVLPCPANN